MKLVDGGGLNGGRGGLVGVERAGGALNKIVGESGGQTASIQLIELNKL